MKKFIVCCFVFGAGILFTGCSTTRMEQDVKPMKPQIVIINNYYIEHPDQCIPEPVCHKHPGEAGYNYSEDGCIDSSHRKQRGRTAPNRALHEHKAAPMPAKEHEKPH